MPLPNYETVSPQGTLLLNTAGHSLSVSQWSIIYNDPAPFGMDRAQVLMAVPPSERLEVRAYHHAAAGLPSVGLVVVLTLLIAVVIAWASRPLLRPRGAMFTR